jgi:leucyl-tRNA synthetase
VHQGTILGTLFRYYEVEGGALIAGDDPSVQADAEGKLRVAGSNLVAHERWATETEVEWEGGVAKLRDQGVTVLPTVEKMAKSRGNVVNPDTIVAETGADSLRVYEMFMGPLEQMQPWQTSGMQGVRRFLDRVDAAARKPLADGPGDLETQKLVHRTVKKVGADIEALCLNTAVSAMMILANHLNGLENPPKGGVEALVLCLAPFAPHLAEELWERLGHPPSISTVAWPSHDEALCQDEEIEIGVQVNGKVRGRILLARAASADDAKGAGLADPNVQKFTDGKAVVKVVYVPGKILNLIVK